MDSLVGTSKFKTYVIAGSIAAVIVGLIVVALLLYRQRALQPVSLLPPLPPGSGTSTVPVSSSGVTPDSSSTMPLGISGLPNAPHDYGKGADADKDGLTDAEEIVYRTDARTSDTDGDGYSDSEEVRVYGTDPRDPKSNPKSVQGLYHPNKGQPGI